MVVPLALCHGRIVNRIQYLPPALHNLPHPKDPHKLEEEFIKTLFLFLQGLHHSFGEVWVLGSISEASEGSQQGAGRRLAVPGSQVQLGSILGDNIYNVPSPRIIPPACPPSVFPADGFSRLLNNWLGSGAPQLTDCCPSVPSLFSRMPKSVGWSGC